VLHIFVNFVYVDLLTCDQGHIAFAEPENACSQIKPPPFAASNGSVWIVVIIRYPCQFDLKVCIICY